MMAICCLQRRVAQRQQRRGDVGDPDPLQHADEAQVLRAPDARAARNVGSGLPAIFPHQKNGNAFSSRPNRTISNPRRMIVIVSVSARACSATDASSRRR